MKFKAMALLLALWGNTVSADTHPQPNITILATGGTIAPDGTWTAPVDPVGTVQVFTVTATSVADPTSAPPRAISCSHIWENSFPNSTAISSTPTRASRPP